MTDNQYYYQSDGEVFGPVSIQRLQALIETGLITPSTMVAREGGQQWVELESILAQLSLNKRRQKKHHWVKYIVIFSQIFIITCLLYNVYIVKISISRIEATIALNRESRPPSVKSNRIERKSDAINKSLYDFAVQQIDVNYKSAVRVIESEDRKVHRELDLQAKLLAIESDKNRKILTQRRLRGEITSSRERDEIEKQDAKDEEDKRMIERKRAEQSSKTTKEIAMAIEMRKYRMSVLQHKMNQLQK